MPLFHFNLPFWKAFLRDFNRFHHFWNNCQERSEMMTSELGGRKATDSHGIVKTWSSQQIGGGKTRKQKRAFEKQPASQPFSTLNVRRGDFGSHKKLFHCQRKSRCNLFPVFWGSIQTPRYLAMPPSFGVHSVKHESRRFPSQSQRAATHQQPLPACFAKV